MRLLKPEEQKKRGCAYCTDLAKEVNKHRGGVRRVCSYSECPYHVLDEYDTYEDYLQSKDSKIKIAALFDAQESGGRLAPGAMAYFPIVRRFGRGGLF